MTWTYRVMRKTAGGETFDAIFEVFLDEHGVITNWSDEPVAARSEVGGSGEGLRQELEYMLAATELCVLDHRTGEPVRAAG